jgi:hypothetical protein
MNREKINKEVNEWDNIRPTKQSSVTEHESNKDITHEKVQNLIQMGNELLAKTLKYLKAD